jgi:hypothetical protein
VIHSNIYVPRIGEALNAGSEDLEFVHALRDVPGNGALLFLQPWDMGVTKHGNAVRAKADHFIYGIDKGCRSLKRQSIDQVNVDRFEGQGAAVFEELSGRFKGLDSVNFLLD